MVAHDVLSTGNSTQLTSCREAHERVLQVCTTEAVPGVLKLHAGASAEWYSERRAHPEKKFQSALVSQLLASLGTSVPLLFARLTRCQ